MGIKTETDGAGIGIKAEPLVQKTEPRVSEDWPDREIQRKLAQFWI